MHDRPAAPMPRGQQDAAMAALVLDVFEVANKVGDAAEAEADADDGGPCTVATRDLSAVVSCVEWVWHDMILLRRDRWGLTWWCHRCGVRFLSRRACGSKGSRRGRRNLGGCLGGRRFGILVLAGRVVGRGWFVEGGWGWGCFLDRCSILALWRWVGRPSGCAAGCIAVEVGIGLLCWCCMSCGVLVNVEEGEFAL